MEAYLFILGRNSELSIEELVTVLSPLGSVSEVNPRFIFFRGSIDPRSLLSTLGGTVKIAQVINTVSNPLSVTVDDWLRALRSELSLNGNRRFNFGLSVLSHRSEVGRHFKELGLALKKHIRKLSIPVRFVCNAELALTSVAVQKERLINRELCVVEGAEKTYLSITEAVQDFEAYGFRDAGRPSRNMRRGMLPPKLAQVMLNLANIGRSDRLIDPFCGGGTILQEALLRGVAQVTGTDKDPAAVAEARQNLEWLSTQFNVGKPVLKVVDMYDSGSVFSDNSFDVVVTEGYLGPANLLRRRSFTRNDFDAVARDTTKLYHFFFKAFFPYVSSGGRMVVVLPLFRLFDRAVETASFEAIEAVGWKWVRPAVSALLTEPTLSSRGALLYERDDQLVAREITVWQKK